MHHIVYKTTHIKTGRIYIGVHSTENLNDKYLGLGVHISRAIKKYGKKAFSREILIECESEDEAYDIEKILVDEKFISRKDVFNKLLGGYGNTGYMPYRCIDSGEILGLRFDDIRRHDIAHYEPYSKNTIPVFDTITNKYKRVLREEYQKDRYHSVNRGKVVVRDKEGKTFRISTDDERLKTGEIVTTSKNMVSVIDNATGEKVFIELKIYQENKCAYHHVQKGMITVKDKEGKFLRINSSDYDANLHQYITSGKVTVKDNNGKRFRVSVSDPRIGITLQYAQPLGKVVIDPISGKNIMLSSTDARVHDSSFVSITTNTIAVRDKEGKTFRTSINDPRYINRNFENYLFL